MKVLMFGWEYPPHILGGLGTASFGIAEGLHAQGRGKQNVISMSP